MAKVREIRIMEMIRENQRSNSEDKSDVIGITEKIQE